MISRDNKYIKLALKLKQRKYRDSEGKYLIEGIRFVEEALREGLVDYVLYSKKLFSTREHERVLDIECNKYEIEDELLRELSGTENPQGVVAVVSKKDYTLDNIGNDFVIIVDGVQDPGNLGTIIRTADAAGVGGVLLVKGTVDLYNDKTLRSTMGSIFHIPIIYSEDFHEAIRALKEKDYEIYATSLEKSKNLYDCNFEKATAVIIGNEANGIPTDHIEAATQRIRIPMPGRSESLNAGIASGVVMYEVVRQRGNY